MSTHDPSGLSIAEEAHAAGVVEPQPEITTCDVSIHVAWRGTQEEVSRLVTAFSTELTARSDVLWAEYTVTPRE